MINAVRANKCNRHLLSRFGARRGGNTVSIDDLEEDEAVCLYKLSAICLTMLDALYEIAKPYLSSPAYF